MVGVWELDDHENAQVFAERYGVQLCLWARWATCSWQLNMIPNRR
jgi:hypothetical protein